MTFWGFMWLVGSSVGCICILATNLKNGRITASTSFAAYIAAMIIGLLFSWGIVILYLLPERKNND